MSKKERPTSRTERARPYLHMMAQLLYIMDEPEPKDYLILSSFKYFKSISNYAKMETVRHLLSIPKKEFYQRVERMRDKEWLSIEGEYANVAGQGDKKLDAAMGWVSYALYNIQERIPLEKWSKLTK